jgi:4,5-DOPA dioxygenase extradiol
MPSPRTIHDFGGFPQKLYDVQYPAPGSPELAGKIPGLVTKTSVLPDNGWGLDHGAWSVIMKMYPDASVPVVQLSLDYRKDARSHYDLAAQLAPLRERGVLIIGSGNLVHNLRMVDWYHPDTGYDWAEEAGTTFRELVAKGDHDRLIAYESLGKAVQQSIPTPEHYLPFLYTLALQRKEEPVQLFNDKAVMGSLSMTSLRIGE